MNKKYIVKFDNQCVELSKPTSTILVYRLPYQMVKNKTHNLSISNRFIVYILFGKNNKGKDIIYVGKSKNGIDNRPTSHEDKNADWTDCYIITDIKERTILNDGTIQYLEDKICNRINDIDKYINTTYQTTSGTANHSDMEDCDCMLDEVFDMCYVLGLNLFELSTDVPTQSKQKEYVQIPSNLLDLFNVIVESAKEVNSDFEIKYTKFYINFVLDNKIIFGIEPYSKCLKVCFNCNHGDITSDALEIEDLTNKGHHMNGHSRISISNKVSQSHIDEIKSLINQTINL